MSGRVNAFGLSQQVAAVTAAAAAATVAHWSDWRSVQVTIDSGGNWQSGHASPWPVRFGRRRRRRCCYCCGVFAVVADCCVPQWVKRREAARREPHVYRVRDKWTHCALVARGRSASSSSLFLFSLPFTAATIATTHTHTVAEAVAVGTLCLVVCVCCRSFVHSRACAHPSCCQRQQRRRRQRMMK